MLIFVFGLIIFFGAHVFTTQRNARMALIGKLGERGYKGLYTLVSLTGFILFVYGWPDASVAPFYTPPYWLHHVTLALVPIAFIFLVAAYAPPSHLAAWAKHPMLLGVKIWAFAHLLSNGDTRSVILFGSFLAYAVFDRIAVKRRGGPVRGAGPWRNDALVVGIGVVAAAIFALWLHPVLIGVPVIAAR